MYSNKSISVDPSPLDNEEINDQQKEYRMKVGFNLQSINIQPHKINLWHKIQPFIKPGDLVNFHIAPLRISTKLT